MNQNWFTNKYAYQFTKESVVYVRNKNVSIQNLYKVIMVFKYNWNFNIFIKGEMEYIIYYSYLYLLIYISVKCCYLKSLYLIIYLKKNSINLIY